MTRVVHLLVGSFGGDQRLVCGADAASEHWTTESFAATCPACTGRTRPSAPATDRVSAAPPVERRATVGGGEARLALLEQHLDEIVKLHTSLHAAERDPMALATDVMELDEQLNAAIEAARDATGGKNG